MGPQLLLPVVVMKRGCHTCVHGPAVKTTDANLLHYVTKATCQLVLSGAHPAEGCCMTSNCKWQAKHPIVVEQQLQIQVAEPHAACLRFEQSGKECWTLTRSGLH
jgi:hypothetical protein